MNDLLYYVLAFGVALGVLIVAHEAGHFLVARWVGVKVVRFSIGFGRTLYVRRFGRDRTEFALSAFPLGGYVKMLDEREGEVAEAERHRAFNRQSVGKRIAIVVAGPFANFVLAIVLYWGVFVLGSEEFRPILEAPVASSPAADAGIQAGERVLKVGGETVQTWQDMRWAILRRAVDVDSIDLEVINARNEIAYRRLDVSSARRAGIDSESLENLGLGIYRPNIPPVIGRLVAGSVAETAGLRVGDEVLEVDGRALESWQKLVGWVREAPGRVQRWTVLRDGRALSITLTPETVEENGAVVGRVGVAVQPPASLKAATMVTVRYGALTALGKAANEVWDKSVFTVVMIGKMLTGDVSWRNISGPVTIADYAGQSARMGVDYYLKFMALISISLAVLNLLPVPVLDGGHLMYYVAELIKGRPLSERSFEVGQRIGIALLIMLMACSFYNDINRLISG